MPIVNCSFCDYSTKSHSSLNVHIRSHTEESPFRCPHPECPKSFTCSSNLIRHQMTHTEQKSFECLECNKKFARTDHLSAHRRTHLKEKSFTCPQCPYATKCNQNLPIHSLYIHATDWPFMCGFAAATNEDLNHHLQVHIVDKAEKKFSCTFCEFSSITNSQLNVHIRTHTGEKPYKCPVGGCPYAAAQSSHLSFKIDSNGNPSLSNRRPAYAGQYSVIIWTP